ncbi:protein-export membrane protein [Candidatus Photodesmus blepharus]|uniref:Protein-export membrane protein SecG n=2 Tax=Candidatus Photodesmus blepharonis TaxID=1179155 RepID=A0A084CP72_9GAMM|nr:protein-export membrane protein [Candidatus Photodesmus blepharus]
MASFGSTPSNTIWGTSGSGSFLTRMTAVFAIVFFSLSLVLGNMSTSKIESTWVDHQNELIASSEYLKSKLSDTNNDEIPK